MRSHTLIFAIFLLFCSFQQAGSQTNYNPDRRVALVIGNSAYDAGRLLNPVNDANAMAAALQETGFEVIKYTDLAYPADMKRAIREFGKKIQNGGVGLFYYAGHGIQANGRNYLIPVKAQIYAEEEVEYETVDVGFVLSQMEIARNRMNIIILDACRNNPFSRGWRSANQGLAFINAPTGTLIAYSTSPGSTASDGTGKNGTYTAALLKQMRQKGMKIEDVFKNVRAEVLVESKNQQTPWESSSLVGDFYFIRPDAETSSQPILSEVSPEKNADAGKMYGIEEEPEFRQSKDQLEWWRGNQNNYFLYRNGVDISRRTQNTRVNNDLLVFDKTAQRTYLFKDYSNARPLERFTPEELLSRSNAFFRSDGDNTYWFYYEGHDLTNRTNSIAYFNDFLIYHQDRGQYYLMNRASFSIPEKFHPAISIYSENQSLWCAADNFYYLYINGEQIGARTFHSWRGNDLIVHDEVTRSSYLLGNYYNNQDRLLRIPGLLFKPGLITATRTGDTGYKPFKNGEPYYMQGEASFSGNDLIIFDTTFNQHLVFKEFLNTPQNTQVQGDPVYARTEAIWRREDGTYWLYIRGVIQTNDMVSARYSLNSQDLEVTVKKTSIIYILENYSNRNDNILRPAALKE